MSPYTKSHSLSPSRRHDDTMRRKAHGSSGRHYSYSRSRSSSLRRPPSPPPMSSSSGSSSSSPMPTHRDRHQRNSQTGYASRGNVVESRCIGVFGLNVHTTQATIREIFAKFGTIERIQVVIDAQTGRSRGFCFIYYKDLESAKEAKDKCCGLEVDGRRIRVDYSITQRPHTPTPGVYMGRPSLNRERRVNDRSRDSNYYSRSRPVRTPPSPPSYSSSHRRSRRSRSRSDYHTEHSRRRRVYDYRSYSRSRSRSYTPRRRSRY